MDAATTAERGQPRLGWVRERLGVLRAQLTEMYRDPEAIDPARRNEISNELLRLEIEEQQLRFAGPT
jgi:hypothetical protein